MTQDRRHRQLRILELVATRPLRTQEELADLLVRDGWDATQSSVSRDVTALGLVKVDGVYQRATTALQHTADPNTRRIAESLLSVDRAGDSMLVLHTPPGEAQRVGSAIDLLAWPDVAGTIGGDDTIFVATRDAAAQRRVERRLRELLTRQP